ncbi:MAG: hypothetical protein AAFY59_00525 [Pseudomonadota bacterium]
MKRTFIALSTATVLAAAAFAPAAVAMDQELSMLEQAVNNQFGQLGIEDVAMGDLTLGQLALVKNVLESDDTTANKKRRIEAIISR